MTSPPPRVSILTKVLRSTALPMVGLGLVAWADFHTRSAGTGEQARKLVQVGYILLGCSLAYQIFCVLFFDLFLARVKSLRVPNILRHILAMVVAGAALAITVNLLFSGALTGFLTLSSVIGIVIGLALRPIILDVFSGISANLDTAFRIGDWVEIRFRGNSSGTTGVVEEINWRTTRIRTRSGNLVICPNSAVGTAIITNFTRPDSLSRFEVPVEIPQEADPGRTLDLLRTAVEAVAAPEHGISTTKAPDVILSGIDDGVVKYLIRFWTNPTITSVDGPRHMVLESVLRHLRLAGIPLARSVVIQRTDPPMLDPKSKEGGVGILSRIEVFSGIPADGLARLAGACATRGFQAGEVLVRQGGTDDELFVIISGAVEVLVSRGDEAVRVARMTAGDWFGEMALLTGEPRSATVRALTNGSAYQVGRAALAPLLQEDASVMELLSRNVARRNLDRESKLRAAGEKAAATEPVGLAAQILERIRGVFRRAT
jgi:small-conductance mechanosensitive channel/CRP-like cAMP-binding protein